MPKIISKNLIRKSLSDEKMDDYYKNLLSSGETIHKATEKLCVDELKQSVGELLKYIHFCMHEYIILEEDLENALSDLTLESREKLKTTVKKAADARQSLISETPDVLLNVAVDSYRKDFRELISPLPRLREKCCKFLNELKEESAVFRQRNTILRSRCLRYKCETAPTNAPTLAMWIPTESALKPTFYSTSTLPMWPPTENTRSQQSTRSEVLNKYKTLERH